MKLLPRMSVKDLRDLAKDKNAQEGVRSMALRMYQSQALSRAPAAKRALQHAGRLR